MKTELSFGSKLYTVVAIVIADCNYYHQQLFKKMDCADQVHISRDGKEALEFLTSQVEGEHPEPDIVFLDINMQATKINL